VLVAVEDVSLPVSDTIWYCVKTAWLIVEIISAPDSPYILFFFDELTIRNSDGITPDLTRALIAGWVQKFEYLLSYTPRVTTVW